MTNHFILFFGCLLHYFVAIVKDLFCEDNNRLLVGLWLSRGSISQDHGWYGIWVHRFPLFTLLNMLNVTNQFYDSVCQIEKASKCSIPSRTCIALD